MNEYVTEVSSEIYSRDDDVTVCTFWKTKVFLSEIDIPSHFHD